MTIKLVYPKEPMIVCLEPVLVPGAAGTCFWCHARHDMFEPHDANSLHYKMNFRWAHKRWPTWSDACCHCLPEVQRNFKRAIREVLLAQGKAVPPDLLAEH